MLNVNVYNWMQSIENVSNGTEIKISLLWFASDESQVRGLNY